MLSVGALESLRFQSSFSKTSIHDVRFSCLNVDIWYYLRCSKVSTLVGALWFSEGAAGD